MGALSGLYRSLIYFPDATSAGPAAHAVPGGRDVALSTDDGLELDAWLLPATQDDRGVAVLYAPGNGGNRAGRIPLHRELVTRGFTVLALDYRGYAGNPGSPTEEGLASDARAAAAYLQRIGFGPDRTIYLGESLGTGVVARLSATHEPAAILLRSPFTSLADVAKLHYGWLPVDALLEDRFPVVDHLAGHHRPVTVVSGDADGIVPAELSARVAAACPRLVEEIVLPGADHNDPIMFGPVVAEALVRLAQEAGAPAT